MAFMRPEYTCEPFHVGENKWGETVAIPASVYGTIERFTYECDIVRDEETITGKWFARFSASGYMDATDWCGPFDSEESARAEIARTYECDPDTGDDDSEGV